MMIFRFKIAFCVLFVGLLTSNTLFSQEQEKQFTKKNLIEVNIPFYHFLDGSRPLFQYAYFGKNNRGSGVALGISYSRLVSDRGLSIEVAISSFFIGYPQPPPGAIIERNASLFSLGASYPFASSVFGDFHIIADVVYRRGIEKMVLNYYVWEAKLKNHGMKDWGLCSGIRLSKDLTKRFVFSAEASVTYFVYRYDKGGTYDFDKGSSKAMLTLSFGLGYRF